MNLMRGHGSIGFGNLEAFCRLLVLIWALSPSFVHGVAAAQVCTTGADGKTVCHDKLSGGVIAAIIVTIVLVLLICALIYYIVRRTRALRMKAQIASLFGGQPEIPRYSARGRRRDEEEGDDSDSDDEKYLSVEKNQIHGPTWEARYDPSSAPLPGKSGDSWSARLRGLRSGARSGSDYGGFGQQPMSAPGHGRHSGRTDYSSSSSSSSSSKVRKPRSAGAEPSKNGFSPSKAKRHWGSLIHGSQSKSGSKSAGSSAEPAAVKAAAVRSRQSPGLYIIAEGPGGFYNAPVIPPITPHTPRTPSRLGAAPPLSAGPLGFSSAPIPPRPPRTAGVSTPLTPRPVPAYSPITPRGHMGAI